jgi:hypothetical protein
MVESTKTFSRKYEEKLPWGLSMVDLPSLREAIPFWFAISSPLLGAILGFVGAWLMASLTS